MLPFEQKRPMSVSAGVIIMVAMRWSDRLIGMVSTLVLARLLLPDDFGIIAMASVVIELIDVLVDMGVATTLIQNRNATKRDYDIAWTLRLLQCVVTALLIWLLAPFAADYFHDARISPVMRVLTLATVISGLENIGVVSFQKNLQFGMDFRFFFFKRLVSFVVTLVAAWATHNYWALVIGTLTLRFSGVMLSYAMHPMRPCLNFSGIKAILSFSTWNLLRSIASHLNENADRLIIGRRVNTVVMGQYTLSSEIAAIPSTELLAPVNRVMLPAFVNVKDDPAQLRATFLLALGIQAMVGIPAGTGLVMVAPELVLTLLGEKWIAAAPFVQVMGAINIATALSASGACVLLALGRQKIVAVNTWLQIILFLAAAIVLIPHQGAMAVALLRLGVAGLGLFSFVYLLTRELPGMHTAAFIEVVWRPCAAAALMCLVLHAVPMSGGLPVALQLAWKVTIGAAVFIAAVLTFWAIAGCHDGPERYLLDKAKLWLRFNTQGA